LVKRGKFYALAVDPRAPNIVYAGTSAGVFKTTDAGESWRQASKSLSFSFCLGGALAIDPRNTRTVYAANCEVVYRSTDAGRTWQAFNHGLADKRVDALAITSGATLYAGTYNGVFAHRN
jgi:photosystem II stability/assembly factor-like uncharacterized protein